MKHVLVAFLLGATTLAAAACSDSPSSPSANDGRFFLRLTDSPFSEARAILVTFSRVRAYRGSPSNFTDVPLPNGVAQYTCDLKKLQSTDAEIGVGGLPPGAYSQIGLVLQSVTVYVDNGTSNAACAAAIPAPSGRSASLAVPSGEVSLARSFDIKKGVDTVMRIDFNGEQSFHVTGDTYSLTPVITVLSVS